MPQKYLKVVAELATSGAIGAALLLGAAAPAAADQEPTARQPASARGERVSERLAAIREAVSAIAGTDATASDRLRLAWHNWGNGWGRGWGWGSPWGNFGFGVPWNNWHNGWNNWRNFWRNW